MGQGGQVIFRILVLEEVKFGEDKLGFFEWKFKKKTMFHIGHVSIYDRLNVDLRQVGVDLRVIRGFRKNAFFLIN